jgi:PTH1 family peptidyl-tRNA hydrolase
MTAEGREQLRLIVGLGNPGAAYAHTRHNVGFRVLDRLADHLGAVFSRRRFQGLYASASDATGEWLFVKPQTFMNLSGECVRDFFGWYKVHPERMLIVLDDVAIAPGVLRLRRGGSHGGHNGLRNISALLGRDDYPRLRVGVGGRENGPANEGEPLISRVLGQFSREEERRLDEVLPHAAEACICWATEGIERAMNRFNAPTDKTPPN